MEFYRERMAHRLDRSNLSLSVILSLYSLHHHPPSHPLFDVILNSNNAATYVSLRLSTRTSHTVSAARCFAVLKALVLGQ